MANDSYFQFVDGNKMGCNYSYSYQKRANERMITRLVKQLYNISKS